MVFPDGYAFDDHALFLRVDFEDFAAFALIGASDDKDHVIFLDIRLSHQSTSGAKDTIFM